MLKSLHVDLKCWESSYEAISLAGFIQIFHQYYDIVWPFEMLSSGYNTYLEQFFFFLFFVAEMASAAEALIKAFQFLLFQNKAQRREPSEDFALKA